MVHSRGEERNAASPEDGLGWGKEIWGLPYLTSALEKADRSLVARKMSPYNKTLYGDIWGHLGTFEDIWGHLGTFGDIWGHLGTFF